MDKLIAVSGVSLYFYLLSMIIAFFIELVSSDDPKEACIVAVAWPLFLAKAIWTRLRN